MSSGPRFERRLSDAVRGAAPGTRSRLALNARRETRFAERAEVGRANAARLTEGTAGRGIRPWHREPRCARPTSARCWWPVSRWWRRSPFAQRAYREARWRGFDTAARRVIIGDGAEWIWHLAAEQFPGAIESSASITPGSICPRSPRPSTAPARTSPPAGEKPGGRSWTRASSTPSWPNSAPTGTPARRPASASTT